MYTKKEKPYPAYVSKHNSNREAWHYLAVKILSAVLRAIMSKHHGSFYCLKCLYSSATESKRESQKKVCENCCDVVILSEDTKILEFNQYQKSDKAPFIIYADLECLIEKIDGCKNNPENSFTIKISEHIPSGFSMSTISSSRAVWKRGKMGRQPPLPTFLGGKFFSQVKSRNIKSLHTINIRHFAFFY